MPVELAALPRFNDDAITACLAAKAYARCGPHDSIQTWHLLAALLDQPWSEACQILRELGQEPRQLRQLIILKRGPEAQAGNRPWSPTSKAAVKEAIQQHLRRQHHYVDTSHLLLGLLSQAEPPVREMMSQRGITAERIARRMRKG